MARPRLDVPPSVVEAIRQCLDEGLSQRETVKTLQERGIPVSRWLVRTRRPGMEQATFTRRPQPSGCQWPGCAQGAELGWAVCSYHRKRVLGLIT